MTEDREVRRDKMKKKTAISLLTAVLVTVCMTSTALAEHFVRIVENGFGNINNRYTWAMTLFTPETGPDRGKQFLYVGTRNEVWSDAGEVHRMDLKTGRWEAVNTNGFGDKSNKGIRTLTVFSNRYGKALYAGTFNLLMGAEVFRTYDGRRWEPVNLPGFGVFDVEGVGGVRGAAVINGDLYYGTSNDVWGVPDPPYLFRFREKRGWFGMLKKSASWEAVISPLDSFNWGQKTYADIIKFTDVNGVTKLYATTWNHKGAWIVASPNGDFGTWEPVMDDGFGRGIIGILSFVEFKGYLYAGTGDPDKGFSVYRSNDPSNPSSWEQVGSDGFGYGGVSRYAWCMAEKNGVLYLGTYNPPNSTIPAEFRGAYMYKTTNGEDWVQVMGPRYTASTPAGFGDPRNVGIRVMLTVGDTVYIGTASHPKPQDENDHGLEIWKMQD